MIQYRKAKSGDYVACGPVDEVRVGTLTISKKDGGTDTRECISTGKPFSADGTMLVYGYLAPGGERSPSVAKPDPSRGKGTGRCRDCGRECDKKYDTCYRHSAAAKAAHATGTCVNCGDPLSQWERSHGVLRCSDCRDGGSRAHGGQSYTDRHGNFVLGDDD